MRLSFGLINGRPRNELNRLSRLTFGRPCKKGSCARYSVRRHSRGETRRRPDETLLGRARLPLNSHSAFARDPYCDVVTAPSARTLLPISDTSDTHKCPDTGAYDVHPGRIPGPSPTLRVSCARVSRETRFGDEIDPS